MVTGERGGPAVLHRRDRVAGAAAGARPEPRPPFLVVDIGGGSTEFVLGDADGVAGRPVGRHRLRPADRAAPARRPADAAAGRGGRRRHQRRPGPGTRRRCRSREAGDAWSAWPARSPPSPRWRWACPPTTPSASTARGSPVADVRRVTAELLAMTRGERAALPVMHPGRVDVIGAGALILRVIMDEFGPHRGRGQRARHPRRHRAAPRRAADARPARSTGRAGSPSPRTPAGVVRAARASAAEPAPSARRARLRLPRLPAAGRLARGGRAGQAGVVPRRGRTGAGRCPGWGRPTRASPSSGSRRPRTAATAPAGCSPATAAATGSSPRCWRAGLANQPTVDAPRRRPRADRRADRRRGALRAAGQHARPRRSATPARPGWPASSTCCRGCGSSWCSAASAGRRCGRCSPPPATRLPRPRPAFGHGAEVDLDRAARPADRAGQLPRQPAEHLHRQADRADARRRPRPGHRPGRVGRLTRRTSVQAAGLWPP